MTKERRGTLVAVGVAVLLGCATTAAVVGRVELADPEPVHGDDTVMAWPFVVTHAGSRETFADFHLQVVAGGTIVGVRPDGDNPDPEARYHWTGEVRAGDGYWIGDVLPPGGQVRLVAIVRPEGSGDPRLRVAHWPTNGRDSVVGPVTCEIWRYDVEARETSQRPC